MENPNSANNQELDIYIYIVHAPYQTTENLEVGSSPSHPPESPEPRLRSRHLRARSVGRQVGPVPDVEAPAHVAAAEGASGGGMFSWTKGPLFSSILRGTQTRNG